MAAPSTTTPSTTTTAPSTTSIKVFVGNLSFKTKDAELQQAFEASGKVVHAKVIRDYSHSHRSLGYGFVEMATLEDAKRSVDAMNKKELDGRQINVELAKPRTEGAPRPPRQNNDNTTRTTNGPSIRGDRRGGVRGTGRGIGRGGRGGVRGTGRGIGRGGRGSGRGGRGGRIVDPNIQRIPSKTVLFVSNLPFTMDDAGFTKIFTDLKFTVKKATVVTRQNGRSKGFGFVEVDSEDSQKKALEALNEKELEGRKLNVRIALTEMHDKPAAPQQPATGITPPVQAKPQPASGKTEVAPAPATQAKQEPAKQEPAKQEANKESPKDNKGAKQQGSKPAAISPAPKQTNPVPVAKK